MSFRASGRGLRCESICELEIFFFGAPRIELGLSAPKAGVLPVYYAPKKITSPRALQVVMRILPWRSPLLYAQGLEEELNELWRATLTKIGSANTRIGIEHRIKVYAELLFQITIDVAQADGA